MAFLITPWIPLLWLIASSTGRYSAGLFLFPSLGQTIDLLGALGLYNNSWVGVTLTEGASPRIRPAYLLQGDYRDLKLPSETFQEVSDLLRMNPEFTISARLRQEPGNIGTIISFAHGSNRYLELQSSGRKNEIRFHYTSRLDSKVYIETFHYKLADNKWHEVAVSVSGSQVELLVDCESLFKRLLKPGVPNRNFSQPVQLWLGQRNIHYYYKGAMQEVQLIGGPHGYLSSCPHLDSTCPTCGQFFLLQTAVQELTRHIQELSKRLEATERRISKIEECDCQKSCRVNGTINADGATWQNGCQLCACMHGEVECRPVECPDVPCKHPVTKSGECCQSCLNIDECQEEGGLEGHHCHQNTICVNTFGSYICECLPGYRRIDKYNCAELDECSSGEHNCDINAECINTQGSYHCGCKEGYSGNGHSCHPICKQNCLNGGICRSPGKCACPNGYTGPSCERDLDECSTNSHRCANASICVNMIGWYYCQCKQGYENPYIDNKLGTKCIDVNECDSDLHTCHPSAQCINIDGSFKCECPKAKSNCKLSCVFEEKEIPHGLSTSPKKDPCQICTCNKGVMTCESPRCNCSVPNSDQNPCCPQCNKKHACQHQELSGVILHHGEQWSYQCQTCECLYGEVDCWEMKCPPLLCENPVRNSVDCCPHCNDPCSIGNSSALGQTCTFAGQIYSSSSQFVDPNDACTACNCKVPYCAELDGVLCCSYSYHCGNDTDPVGFDGMVASTASGDGYISGFSGNNTKTTFDVTEQYNSALQMGSYSNEFVYISDSSRDNKTEKSSTKGPSRG
ncbi:protein kinase C-binding protein NELL1-like isoform X3 [Anoplophora glabripennis]|uniref:protein kinase C-binding protein NELL1-like isoform X3 n=1 Tax=Anoplophora glabripennis TaxID=217634 RepID=UPI000874C46A|nr:protein kinase C-binding protein NELL1-like isoform X3 [Anoplophora glabripennis]